MATFQAAKEQNPRQVFPHRIGYKNLPLDLSRTPKLVNRRLIYYIYVSKRYTYFHFFFFKLQRI